MTRRAGGSTARGLPQSRLAKTQHAAADSRFPRDQQTKPNVEFGVSPAGVWRNRSFDPAGSDTRGAAAYDESYADTRQWVQQGCWTTSRRRFTGPSPGMPRATTC
jgi:hypothetical protein